MKRLLMPLAPVVLAMGICTLLQADNAVPALAAPGNSQAACDLANARLWNVEHSAAMAKDPDFMGVWAVQEAGELLGQRPQVAIDFFTKELFNSKSHAVQRAVRMQLVLLYKQAGQTDQALTQLQALIDEPQ